MKLDISQLVWQFNNTIRDQSSFCLSTLLFLVGMLSHFSPHGCSSLATMTFSAYSFQKGEKSIHQEVRYFLRYHSGIMSSLSAKGSQLAQLYQKQKKTNKQKTTCNFLGKGQYILHSQLTTSVTNIFPGPRIEISPKQSKRINKWLQLENKGHLNNFETKDEVKTLTLALGQKEPNGYSYISTQ